MQPNFGFIVVTTNNHNQSEWISGCRLGSYAIDKPYNECTIDLFFETYLTPYPINVWMALVHRRIPQVNARNSFKLLSSEPTSRIPISDTVVVLYLRPIASFRNVLMKMFYHRLATNWVVLMKFRRMRATRIWKVTA